MEVPLVFRVNIHSYTHTSSRLAQKHKQVEEQVPHANSQTLQHRAQPSITKTPQDVLSLGAVFT